MNPIVSIMAQGGMGAATAARLAEHGIEVRTSLAGRSSASAGRAEKAGMRAVTDDQLVAADFFLSIVPPAEAVPLARHMAPHLQRAARKPVYIDFNAVSPQTANEVAAIVTATGAPFADGGIIGLPPKPGSEGPVYYVSGPGAESVRRLADFGLKVRTLAGPVWAASALKMSYAGITKGLIAMGTSMILAASRAGIADALYAELLASQPNLLTGFTRSIPDMFGKANRWVAELEEIADFAGNAGAEHEIYAAIARLYQRIGADFDHGNNEIDVLTAFFPRA